MLPRFRGRFGERAAAFADAFLASLRAEEHRSHARVWFLFARRG